MTELFDDIRQIYRFAFPCGRLSEYIEFFSESSFEKTNQVTKGENFTVKMFPSWTPTIWINLGSPYTLTLGCKVYRIDGYKDVLVLRDSNAVRHNYTSDHIFTIKFFPGGLEAILGVNQVRLIGKVLDAYSVIPQALIRQVKMQNSFDGRTKLVEEYFLLRLQKQKPADHYIHFVRDSIDMYDSSGMRYNTSEVAEKIFLTSKTINRYFNSVVGTSPKKYFSILRARKALSSYLSAKASFDPAQFGYYDMSHFYKEAARFTGQRLALQK